ncbi:MAG TPA: glycosyltransferase family 2 protein [Chitinophagaceae bacterium]|nr:glycosyltransferase family 2 protein [Chitinophagaceae bacterium]
MNAEQNPKVSIITCFLNVEAFLEECIESILNQTYQNWELLLIDDGSTDKCTEIAKRYSAKIPDKIFYIEHAGHENKGLSFSRNTGLRYASGKLLAFLDGDDVWLPSYLTEIINCWQEQDVAMVCEASLYWRNWSGTNNKDYKLKVGVEEDRVYQPPELLKQLYPLGSGDAPCICGLIVEKKAVIACGGFEKHFPGMYEDQALLVKLYKQERIYVSSTCNNKYRQRRSSLVISSHLGGNYRQERKRFLHWMKDYFLIQGWLTSDIQRFLDRALFPYHFPVIYFFSYRLPQKVKKWMQKETPVLQRTGK